MRLLAIRVGLIEPQGPSHGAIDLQAAADEVADAPVGRWFSANVGVGNLVAIASLVLTLVGGYVSLRSTQQSEIVELRERDAAKEKEMAELRKADDDLREEVNRRFLAIGARFQADVVTRHEYENNNLDIGSRFNALQTWQLQVNGHLIQGTR